MLDASGLAVESLDIPSFPVLPKREQRFQLPLKVDPATVRALRVKVDLGTDEIQEATVELGNNGGEAN